MTWKSTNYSSSDMMAMQRDAMRRVQEMQRIAKSRVNGGQDTAAAQSAPAPPVSAPSPNRPQQAPSKQECPVAAPAEKNILQELLSGLNLDHDRLIILLLLIVLMNEGVDGKLLLALCYLLL